MKICGQTEVGHKKTVCQWGGGLPEKVGLDSFQI